MKNLILKSSAASLCITIGCCVNLFCCSKGLEVQGAILFACGLLCVCYKSLSLYTGMVGYTRLDKKFLSELLVVLVANLVFSYLYGLLLRFVVSNEVLQTVSALVSKKSTLPFISLFIKSLFCGVLMFLAVDIFKQKSSPLGILFCVPVFILCGFEHCVANMTYFGMARELPILPTLVVIAGNSCGSIITNKIVN